MLLRQTIIFLLHIAWEYGSTRRK